MRTLIALVSAVSFVLAGCAQWRGDAGDDLADAAPEPPGVANPKGDGKARCDGAAIGYVGTINGYNAELGRSVRNGVELAVRRHNEANKNCLVELVEHETEGVAAKAPGIVSGMVGTKRIIGVVGLPFSDEAERAGEILHDGGLVLITPSATSNALADNGWKTFFRATGNDSVQGKAAAKFLTKELAKKKVCVVNDDSSYGSGLAKVVKDSLGDKATCEEQVKRGQDDFDGVAEQIKEQRPDAVYYAGYYPEAAPFAKQLRAVGVEAQFVGSDGAKDGEFVKGAGDAAAGAYFTCSCVPSAQFERFVALYERAFGVPPGTYSVEAYDAATVLLTGIDAGHQDRKSLLRYVGRYKGKGLSNQLDWDDKGELAKSTAWAYKVAGGKIVSHAEIR